MIKRNRRLRTDKRASAQDIIYVIVVLFALGLGMVVYYTIGSKMNDKFQSMSQIPAAGKNMSDKAISYYPSVMDKAVPFIMVMMAIIMLIMSMMVSVHPVFLVLFFIVWIVAIILSVIFADAYEMISTSEMFANYAANLTMTNFTIKILPWITGVLGMLLMAVMYKGKKYNEPT